MKEILKDYRVIFIIICLVLIVIASFNDKSYEVTITDKERITNKESSKYLVFAEGKNGESYVFENTDCLLRFKFNSSNIQGELKVGETYTITVVGYRVPILSMYENIIKVSQ